MLSGNEASEAAILKKWLPKMLRSAQHGIFEALFMGYQ